MGLGVIGFKCNNRYRWGFGGIPNPVPHLLGANVLSFLIRYRLMYPSAVERMKQNGRKAAALPKPDTAIPRGFSVDPFKEHNLCSPHVENTARSKPTWRDLVAKAHLGARGFKAIFTGELMFAFEPDIMRLSDGRAYDFGYVLNMDTEELEGWIGGMDCEQKGNPFINSSPSEVNGKTMHRAFVLPFKALEPAVDFNLSDEGDLDDLDAYIADMAGWMQKAFDAHEAACHLFKQASGFGDPLRPDDADLPFPMPRRTMHAHTAPLGPDGRPLGRFKVNSGLFQGDTSLDGLPLLAL